MCGIAAIFAYSSTAPPLDRDELTRVRDSMTARGPDDFGEWFSSDNRVGFGHRRLSIIDLSDAGHQPMLNERGTLVINFNGEIYNHLELRAELESKGHRFKSDCDTEVILHLFEEEGEAMLEKLRGMFAFTIWDVEKRELFLARDPFGVKPLYYSDDGKVFRVASQVKALLRAASVDTSIQAAGHVGFFLWGHVPEPYTLYKGILALPAGHSMRIARNGAEEPKGFCSISDMLARGQNDARPLPPETVRGELRSALLDSVRHHLIADVPVGAFLSSGLDSTTLMALASEFGGRLKTVTLAFEEFAGTQDDESPLAEEVARRYGTDHQTIRIGREDFEKQFDRLLDAMDQPTTDGVNTFFVSKAAKQAGLKVALSGLGGDELFGGYSSFHQIPSLVNLVRRLHLSTGAGRFVRRVSLPLLKHLTSPKYAGLLEYGSTYAGAYLLRRAVFMPWELSEVLDDDVVKEGWAELQTTARLYQTTSEIRSDYLKVASLEMNWYLRNQLLRDADWAGMAHSLEIRVPFLDVPRLARMGPEFAGPEHPTKLDMAQTPQHPLPREVLNRKKPGSPSPSGSGCRNDPRAKKSIQVRGSGAKKSTSSSRTNPCAEAPGLQTGSRTKL